MKRTLKSLTAILVVLTLCLGLMTACGSDGIVGKWKLTGANAAGVDVDPTTLFGEWILDFKSNGKAEIIMNGQTSGESSYTLEGDNKAICDGLTFVLTDGHLTTEAGGATLIFTRA